jgi:hypothetical protein
VPEGLQDLPLFARQPEIAKAASAAPAEAPAVAAPVEPPAVAPALAALGEPPPVVGAAPVPVLNFTARLTEKAFKEGMAQVVSASRHRLP